MNDAPNPAPVATTSFVLQAGWQPGCIGRIAELHGRYYAREAGFGAAFESQVARELGAFCERLRDGRDGLWLSVGADGRVEGAIAIDGAPAEADPGGAARLRWFIVSDALRGRGAGRALLDVALAFCRARGHRRIALWTFEGLHAARRLYEQAGFRLVEQHVGSQWGAPVQEQRFELALGDAP